MSILINESHAPSELWVRTNSTAVASFSETFQFASNLVPVQNIPMVLGSATFGSLSKGAVAGGYIYVRNLFNAPITGNLYITTAGSYSSAGSNGFTITIPNGNTTFNLSSLMCSSSGGNVVYLVFVPTSVIPTPTQTMRAYAGLPRSIAYSSMPSNAFISSIGSVASTWVKGT